MSKPRSRADPELLRQLEEQITIREKLDIQSLLFRQVERCNISISNPDPSIFEANVRILMSLLPPQSIDKVRTRTDEFNKKKDIPLIETFCGVPMVDYDEDGKPLPPKYDEQIFTDYEILYEFIMAELAKLGITYSIEQLNIELGAVRDEVDLVPGPMINSFKKQMQKFIIKWRKKGYKGTFEDLAKRVSVETMPTPYVRDKNNG